MGALAGGGTEPLQNRRAAALPRCGTVAEGQPPARGHRKWPSVAIRGEWLCIQIATQPISQPERYWLILGDNYPVILELKLTFQAEILASGII